MDHSVNIENNWIVINFYIEQWKYKFFQTTFDNMNDTCVTVEIVCHKVTLNWQNNTLREWRRHEKFVNWRTDGWIQMIHSSQYIFHWKSVEFVAIYLSPHIYYTHTHIIHLITTSLLVLICTKVIRRPCKQNYKYLLQLF